MKSYKKLGMCILIFLALAISMNQALALGVTPGKKIIEFEPKLREEKTITVVNTDYREFRAAILVEGDLAPYIKLNQQSIDFAADEGEKTFTYEILLPESLGEPGLHEARIEIREIPDSLGSGEIEVGALISIKSRVQVRVPYPGKYAEAELDILSDTKDVQFFVRASNLGQEEIGKANAVIYVYDSDNNLLTALNTESSSLKPKQRKELKAEWKANSSLGNYRATVIFDYDGVVETISKNFVIGDFFIQPIDISVNDFKLGDVAKFDILVENIANQPVNNLFTEMTLFDREDNQVAALKSVPVNVQPGARGNLETFWVTDGIEAGQYHGKIKFQYADSKMERDLKVLVEEDAIQAEIVGITGMVVAPNVEQPSEPGDSQFIIGMLVMLVIVLVVVVLVLVFIVLRRNKS